MYRDHYVISNIILFVIIVPIRRLENAGKQGDQALQSKRNSLRTGEPENSGLRRTQL